MPHEDARISGPRLMSASMPSVSSSAGGGMAERPLYFLHVPKTAGTSFRAYLTDHYDVSEVCPAWLLEEIFNKSPSWFSQYRLIAGHFAGYLERMLAVEPMMVTLLREPIARSVSHYLHIRRTPETSWHEQVRRMTFEEFVFSDIGELELLNFQTRFLALDEIQEGYMAHRVLEKTDPGELLRRYRDRRMFEAAARRLERCAVVGLVERLADAIRLLGERFVWPTPPAAPRYNEAPDHERTVEVSPKVRARLEVYNNLDLELYRLATGRFEADLGAWSEGRSEAAYGRMMAAKPKVSRVAFGFERAIMGWGWHPREKLADGTWARWTGPGPEAVMDLPLAEDRELEIQFLGGVYSGELLPTVTLEANGRPVPLLRRAAKLDTTPIGVFSGVLTPEALRAGGGYTRLRFRVDEPIVPAERIPGDPDTRSLGIYFRWLEIFPKWR